MLKCLQCTKVIAENKTFCSASCSTTYRNIHRDYSLVKNTRSIKMRADYELRPTLCITCKTPLLFEKRKGKFCSHSCAAKENNKGVCRWERSQVTVCGCGGKKSPRGKICINCKTSEYSQLTIGDLIKIRGKYSYRTALRTHARLTLRKSKVCKSCKFCTTEEFKSILEVCHIKGVAEFSLEAKLEEVNDLSNLIYLCPNHHVLFDRGLIKLTSVV